MISKITQAESLTEKLKQNLRFQNCAILDSNKTICNKRSIGIKFQNCAILDSNKTKMVFMVLSLLVLELCYFRQ